MGRRVIFAGIWGLLGAVAGSGIVAAIIIVAEPESRGRSPDGGDWGRGLMLDGAAIALGFVGMAAGAVFGGLQCFAPKIHASWLCVAGGSAVSGFVTTAISAFLGWEQVTGWTWLAACFASLVFVFLLAFFLVGRIKTRKDER